MVDRNPRVGSESLLLAEDGLDRPVRWAAPLDNAVVGAL
jgi:hypothetical protein